eukprot:303206_1
MNIIASIIILLYLLIFCILHLYLEEITDKSIAIIHYFGDEHWKRIVSHLLEYRINVPNVENRKKGIQRYAKRRTMLSVLSETGEAFVAAILVEIPRVIVFPTNLDLDAQTNNTFNIVFKMMVGKYLFDLVYYFVHRILQHHPRSPLYKYHKKHHEVISPTLFDDGHNLHEGMVLAAVQKIVSFSLNMNWLESILFSVALFMQLTEVHSGYELPFRFSIFSYLPGKKK